MWGNVNTYLVQLIFTCVRNNKHLFIVVVNGVLLLLVYVLMYIIINYFTIFVQS